MAKLSRKSLIMVLSLCGIAASFLPWSGMYRGSLPPGNLPDTIFYGFQVNGIYCAACFSVIFLVLLTVIKKPMTEPIAFIIALLAVVSLVVSVSDIAKIALQGNIVGTVPFLREGPYVVSFIAVAILALSICESIKSKRRV